MTDATLINRATVLRLYPNRAQAAALRRWQGGLRFAWNATWNWCKQQRESAGKWPGKAAIQAHIVALKKEEATAWMQDTPAHALLKLADDMQRAMRNWFEKRARMPKFRGKYARQFSVYMVNQNTTFTSGTVKLPKLGAVKWRGGALPEGRLLSSRVYCEAGKWLMASVFECTPPKAPAPAVARVGIDMGLKTLATVFDGARVSVVQSPKALAERERRLKRYQRTLSRRKKFSKRRWQAKQRAARLHRRIANIRKDVTHKATSAIVASAGAIVVENLSIKGMARNGTLGKAVHDAGMGAFLSQLKYKAAWAGREVVEADRWLPSSKTCSACGEIHEMPLSRRWMLCTCGNEMDRDENAARNLFAYGEERRNVARVGVETRAEKGEQAAAATLRPVPFVEARMSKQGMASAVA